MSNHKNDESSDKKMPATPTTNTTHKSGSPSTSHDSKPAGKNDSDNKTSSFKDRDGNKK